MKASKTLILCSANFNLVPSALMTTLECIQDPDVVYRAREEVAAHFPEGQWHSRDTDPKRLLDLPLLSSIYAESLRLHIKVFFFASSPHSDVLLGKWKLPREGLGLVNTDIPHTDTSVWNTKNGLHPVDSFWAERFLVDPSDSSSGPLNTQFTKPNDAMPEHEHEKAGQRKYFSTEGLGGSWIPYGGKSCGIVRNVRGSV